MIVRSEAVLDRVGTCIGALQSDRIFVAVAKDMASMHAALVRFPSISLQLRRPAGVLRSSTGHLMTACNIAVFSKTIARPAARLIGLFGIHIRWSPWLAG